MLEASSPYFAALLSGGFVEEQSRTVTLAEDVDDVRAFRAIVKFMHHCDYTQELDHEKNDSKTRTTLCHVNIMLMANRLCMGTLEELTFRNVLSSLRDLVERDARGCHWDVEDFYKIVGRVNTLTPSKESDDSNDRDRKTSVAAGGNTRRPVSTGPTVVLRGSTHVTFPTDGRCSVRVSPYSIPKRLPAVFKLPKPTNRLRTALGAFTSYKLDRFRAHPFFKEIKQKYPEFASDIVKNVYELEDDDIRSIFPRRAIFSVSGSVNGVKFPTVTVYDTDVGKWVNG